MTSARYLVDRFRDRLEIIDEESEPTVAGLRGGADNRGTIELANMFAAAPEVTDVLGQLLDAIDAHHMPKVLTLVPKAKAALAKARGKQPAG